MKKMISIAVAALSINSAFACEPYGAFGFGPYAMIPNLTLGARFDDCGGDVDVSLTQVYDEYIQITRLAMTRLIHLDSLYIGPSYAISFHRIKHIGSGSQGLLGGVIGKDSTTHFYEMSAYVPAVYKGLKMSGTQVMFKVGVKF